MTEHIIYISPHLDDVVLSCGGLVYEQVKTGATVEIWTLTAKCPDPQSLPNFARLLHERWGTDANAVQTRREEDLKACQILGAQAMHLRWMDCIYRFREDGEALVQVDDDIFNAVPEPDLIESISDYLHRNIPATASLVFPIGIGSHVDHRLTCLAVQASGLPGLYYADYPYVTYNYEQTNLLEAETWQRLPTVISESGLLSWQKAVAAYKSQLSTFWRTRKEMRLAISNYWAGGGGRLWRKAPIQNKNHPSPHFAR